MLLSESESSSKDNRSEMLWRKNLSRSTCFFTLKPGLRFDQKKVGFETMSYNPTIDVWIPGVLWIGWGYCVIIKSRLQGSREIGAWIKGHGWSPFEGWWMWQWHYLLQTAIMSDQKIQREIQCIYSGYAMSSDNFNHLIYRDLKLPQSKKKSTKSNVFVYDRWQRSLPKASRAPVPVLHH